MKILLIDDDMELKEIMSRFLFNYNYDFFYAKNGSAGLRMMSIIKPDIVLLDISLPDISGIELCKKIRSSNMVYGEPHIIMITIFEEAEYVVEGFSAGADDYVKKPFDPREILSRITFLKKRYRNSNTGILNYKELRIDLEKQIVMDKGYEIMLTKKEYELLVYFVQNAGAVMEQPKIYNDVWQSPYYPGNKTVEQFLHKLKNKVTTFKENIVNLKGFGYKLVL